ncbi:MAG TPA: hypothetical protein DEB24_07390 [Coriobacteriia bacterium]|nr:hypothetical protein [Coriobacteriia bacterium]
MSSEHNSIKGLDDVFRRLSFGPNPEYDSVTSAFVSLGLILNYLDCKNDNRVIPDILGSEALRGSDWSAARYPRTNQFIKELRRLFGGNPKQFELWGKRFATKFNKGWLGLYWAKEVFVRSAYSGLGKEKVWELVTAEVAANRPVLVIMKTLVIGEQPHNNYAVTVCGYRLGSMGARELMVHVGQYGDDVRGSRVRLDYVSLDQAICAYRFSVFVQPTAMFPALRK